MIKNHACDTIKPKYLLDLRVPNDSTLFLVTPNEKETNVNDVKGCSTCRLIENAWDLF